MQYHIILQKTNTDLLEDISPHLPRFVYTSKYTHMRKWSTNCEMWCFSPIIHTVTGRRERKPNALSKPFAFYLFTLALFFKFDDAFFLELQHFQTVLRVHLSYVLEKYRTIVQINGLRYGKKNAFFVMKNKNRNRCFFFKESGTKWYSLITNFYNQGPLLIIIRSKWLTNAVTHTFQDTKRKNSNVVYSFVLKNEIIFEKPLQLMTYFLELHEV